MIRVEISEIDGLVYKPIRLTITLERMDDAQELHIELGKAAGPKTYAIYSKLDAELARQGIVTLRDR